MKHVVVVEDNEDLLDEVVFHLSRQPGYTVYAARDGRELDDCLVRHAVDVLVLDLGLPGEDGIEIARRVRRQAMPGIVMLTARGALDERITGLQSGADAYLVKPVDMRELVAVIDSVHRRLVECSPPQPALQSEVSWVFYPRRWQIRTPKGHLHILTAAESRIVQALVEADGQTVARHTLAEVEGLAALDFDYRRLESTVSRLRRKLTSGGDSSPLRAARGQGYAFTESVRIDTEGAEE